MKNISKVVWSQRAKNDLESVLDYLDKNRTEKVMPTGQNSLRYNRVFPSNPR